MISQETPTVRQLAAWAGVSIATISRALRNHPSIPLGTRSRIQQLAKEKGYRMDPVVASLMANLRVKRTQRAADKLAFLVPWPAEAARNSASLQQTYAGAGKRAEELGYDVEMIFSKEPGMTAARLSRILYTRAIRGLILAPLSKSVGHVSLNWSYFSAVALGYTAARPALNRVVHDHFGGMQTILRELHRAGYRRIGFAAPFAQHTRVGKRWLASFLVYQAGLPKRDQIPHLLLRQGAPNSAELLQWTRNFQPDAVVGDARGILDALKQTKIQIPQELGFAALDLTGDTEGASGIDQRPYSIGYASADMLIKQLQQNEMGIPAECKVLAIDGVWREGSTTRLRTSQ